MFQKNDEVVLKIEDIGKNGEGIGKADGFAFFVRDAVPGDRIRARILKVKKHYGYAKPENMLEPSPDRVTPKCGIAGPCGGCQLSFLSYAAQLSWKTALVTSTLERIGGFTDPPVEDIIGMEEPYRYRNKAQIPVGTAPDGSPSAGFYAVHSHRIIPCDDCPVCSRDSMEIAGIVISWMKANQIAAYDEKTGKGLVRHILIRNGYYTGELLVCLVINGTKLPASEQLIQALAGRKQITGIVLNVNRKPTNVILGDRFIPLYGRPKIRDRIGRLSFEISPQSFFQVNPVQTGKLYQEALEYADPGPDDTVMDLYCGIGTISLFLAQKAGRVFGVETIPEAVRNAEKNARENQIRNAEFIAGKAEEVVPKLLQERNIHADIIVLDPPRKGCEESLLRTILKHRPERIVYISCDPATLARDLKILCGGGYDLRKVQPVDMFPQTVHVETVCLLSNRKPDARIKIDVNLEDYYRIKDAKKSQSVLSDEKEKE